MKYGIYIIGFFILGCSSSIQHELKEDTYVELVIDMQIAEAATKDLSGVVKDSMYQVYIGQIAERHSMTPLEIQQHLMTLEKDIDLFLIVYEKAQNHLRTLE